MQARFKHMILRFSQGELRRARFEQARLIALHQRVPGKAHKPRLQLAVRVVLWLHMGLFLSFMALLLSGCSSIPDVAITEAGVKTI